jgi:hypothetical protein
MTAYAAVVLSTVPAADAYSTYNVSGPQGANSCYGLGWGHVCFYQYDIGDGGLMWAYNGPTNSWLTLPNPTDVHAIVSARNTYVTWIMGTARNPLTGIVGQVEGCIPQSEVYAALDPGLASQAYYPYTGLTSNGPNTVQVYDNVGQVMLSGTQTSCPSNWEITWNPWLDDPNGFFG